MKFDELDEQMRVYETAHDHCVLPGVYMVARLDGRGFTRLTKELMDYEAPFDERFRDSMINTVRHLMDCGFRISYGYTQSDEISLLLHPDSNSFGRKERKLNSVLAGDASAALSLDMGHIAPFDCRISQLPNRKLVVDYFRWRNEDAHRNALNAHCYWRMRKQGTSAKDATQQLLGKSIAEKNEFLFQNGINFNEIPNWQKRGVGLFWEEFEKEGFDPIKQAATTATRRRLKVELDLPMRDEYSEFVSDLLES
ncbi:MAG: tRNA(His) guanylyltransferase Thg1 family protein [Verrucomicrobiota bacterium]